MNLQSLRRFTPALALSIIALDLAALPMLDSGFSASARYGQCVRMAAGDPGKAIAFAHAWRAGNGGLPMARHCEAVALFAAKDYRRAAEAFAGLAKEANATNPTLARELTAQAAKSYEAAGEPDMAKALSSAPAR